MASERRRAAIAAIALTLSAVSTAPAAAQGSNHLADAAQDYRTFGGGNSVISLTFENDYFAGTDRNYTNGVRLAFMSAPREIEGWSGFIAKNILGADPDYGMRVGLAVGQSIFTPEDFTETDPLPDQHPYAGWLYFEHSVLGVRKRSLSRLTTQLGVVGPSAGAEWAQNTVHEFQGGEVAEGWDNQLRDEIGFTLTYERAQILFQTPRIFGLESDGLVLGGATAGNVISEAKVGGMWRIGRNIRTDAGPPRIRPGLAGGEFFDKGVGNSWYAFIGAQGRAVAWNIFLDGNSFDGDAEPQVERIPYVADFQAGVVLRFGRVQLAYQVVARTEEFETQDDNQVFGALSFAAAF
ncbi:MAG: lipid A deacylase LpxR family protein [Pseudomonadota bacterium]